METEQTRAQRLRRAARRQGLTFSKIRRMDRRAIDYGRYRLTDQAGTVVVGADQAGADLDEVEAYLDRDLDDDEAERRVYCLAAH